MYDLLSTAACVVEPASFVLAEQVCKTEAFIVLQGFHSIPTYLNVFNNALMRANLPMSKGSPAAYGITVINHPMNKTAGAYSS